MVHAEIARLTGEALFIGAEIGTTCLLRHLVKAWVTGPAGENWAADTVFADSATFDADLQNPADRKRSEGDVPQYSHSHVWCRSSVQEAQLPNPKNCSSDQLPNRSVDECNRDGGVTVRMVIAHQNELELFQLSDSVDSVG